MNLSSVIAEDEVSLCPFCDNPMMLDMDETVVIGAHGCKCLVHKSCVQDLERAQEDIQQIQNGGNNEKG